MSTRKELPHCKRCGKEFGPNRFWQRFCSPECQKIFHKEEYKKAMEAFRSKEDKADAL
jgi:predicted nucleic acid-binding Zn ribbon protein